MSDQVVRTEVVDGIGTIVLDRPEQLNAITVALGAQLEQALLDLGARADVHVVVVRGAGGNLSAGGDFHEVQRLREEGPAGLLPLFENFRRACAATAAIDQPVVTVVEGAAAAGGFEFMLASDLVLVHEAAKVSDNHIRFGQIPGGGSTQRLARLIGRQRALGLLLGGDRLIGQQVVDAGLAHRCFAAETFEADVAAFVRALADRDPRALRGIKRLVTDGVESTLEEGLERELDAVVDHIAGEAGQTGFNTFVGGGRA